MPRLRRPQFWSVNVFPMLDYYIGEIRTPLYVLLGATGLVLLIACVNVASLLLARGSAREAEISLRASLGASRNRIVQQLLTEGLVLGLAGGVLGVSFAYIGNAVMRKLSLASIPRFDQVTVDHTVLTFTILLSAVTGLLFGALPAIRLSRTTFLILSSPVAGRRLEASARISAAFWSFPKSRSPWFSSLVPASS